MLATSGQIAIQVSDLGRSAAFYRDALQIPFVFGFPGLAFFDCGGIRLMLTLPVAGSQTGVSSVLYFKVADLRAETQALAERGVNIEREPHLVAKLPDHELWMLAGDITGLIGAIAHFPDADF